MRTYFIFKSGNSPDLRGFAEDASGSRLPPEYGPWALVQQIGFQDEWSLGISRAVVATGILENGFYLWGPREQRPSTKPIIESDRVEGTAVYDREGGQIGTIKRLLIEKVSGKVLYVDVTFGGFLGLGAHHHTIPWEKLSYDRELGGYRTEVSEEQVRGAPSFYGDGQVWPDTKAEQETRRYWNDPPRFPT
jgi:PRC-barrel domain